MNIPAPASWLTAVENRGCGVIKERKVIRCHSKGVQLTSSPTQVEVKESVAELIATGLRRRDGITLAAWQEVSLIRNIYLGINFDVLPISRHVEGR